MIHPSAGVVVLLAQVGDAGGDASSQLTMVIAGLLVLAAVITVATVLFWRATRPPSGSERPAMSWRDGTGTEEDDAGSDGAHR